MSGKTKILLIDDEALVREELGGLLEDEGYLVVTGADGEEGLELFRSEAPDMVITDVRMPRKDGLSVAVTIRQEDPGVPVSVITGHGSESLAIEALRSGVIDFIKKPVRLEDLTSALTRMEAARRPPELRYAEMPPTVKLLSHTWVYRLGNDLEAIPGFVDAMLRQCTEGIDRMAVLELSLALRELILNAVEHGNLGLSYQEKTRALEAGTIDQLLEERTRMPEYRDRSVTISACRQERRLTFSIKDEGEGFDWRILPDPADTPDLFSIHGRGVLLSRMSVDSLEFNERGNEVKVEKLF
jgi:FixJ family two-component response regulator/anti-sigma regulatory factor (Ser/Thr protein kinase)